MFLICSTCQQRDSLAGNLTDPAIEGTSYGMGQETTDSIDAGTTAPAVPTPPTSGLSDHFHRVRLTSLVLSCTLLLITVRQPGKEVSLLGVTINETSTPYLIVALLVAALFSFGHAFTLWYNETRGFEAKIRTAKAQMSDIRDIVSNFKKMETRVALSYRDLAKADSSLSELDTKFYQKDQILDIIQNLYPSDDDELRKEIHGVFVNILNNFPEPSALADLIDNAVNDYFSDKKLKPNVPPFNGDLSALITNRLMNKYRARTYEGAESYENVPEIAWQQLMLPLNNWTFRQRALIQRSLTEDFTRSEQIKGEVERAHKAVRDARNDIIAPLVGAREELNAAVAPLQKTTVAQRALIYGFDLASALGLFVVAAISAIGSLLLVGQLQVAANIVAVWQAAVSLPWWIWPLCGAGLATAILCKRGGLRRSARAVEIAILVSLLLFSVIIPIVVWVK